MKIATRINVLFLSVAVLLGLVATGFTAFREYHIARERLVEVSLASILSRPDLQLEIYRRNSARLEQALESLIEPPGVVVVTAMDGQGEELARRERGRYRIPPFQALRGELSVTETGLTAVDSLGRPAGTGLWSALTGSDMPMHLTVPVFTSVNPVQRGLEPVDFLLGLGDPAARGSLRVIGYIQVGMDRGELLAQIQPAINRVFIGSLVLIILCAGAVFLMTRRITADISRITDLADELAAGNLKKPVAIEASGEFTELANILNSVIGGFSNFKKEVDVDNRLLNMKVNERTTQLTRRDEELNKAAEEISETRTRLQRLANYDSLTSLPNRRLFTEQLNLLLGLNQRNGHTLALLFLNLDNFKRINDSLGQSVGDLTLREVGRRLAACVRDSDAVAHFVDADMNIDVARLGGDEFTVVLNQLDTVESAALVAQRLADAFSEPMTVDGHELVVTPSIGIAIAPGNGADVEALLKAASIAMHHAKASTRETYLFFSDDMEAAAGGRLKLEADLRKAVARNEMVLHYQPQVNTHTGSVAGVEALLRWQHPEHGLLEPAQFLTLAEETGVIGQLGDWVLAEVCRQLQDFDAQGLTLPRVTINISALQFTSGFVQQVRDLLAKYELSPARLEMGLSEGILMDSDRTTVHGLQELRELGVHLSVDDFGAGYSPLSYLSSQSLDELRIDRKFVHDCDRSEEGAKLVKAIIAMAGSLGLGIVAEGVESEEQYRFLTSNGADVLQGYLLSKPVPAEELRPMLAPWHFMAQLQKI